MGEFWDIQKVLNWTSNKFKSIGIKSYRLDAELIISHVLNVNRIFLYVNFNKPLLKEELVKIKNLIKLRLNRLPIAYIIGKKEFMSLPFFVEKGVFIPRPETECLIEEIIENKNEYFEGKTEIFAADLCSGSGCIGISLAYYLKLNIDFFEIDKKSINCIKINCKNNLDSIGNIKYNIIKSDILNLNIKNKYNLVVSNPPYIPDKDIKELEPEVKKYHNYISLSGKEDGLFFYRKIIPYAKNILNKNGILALEFGINQHENIKKIMIENGYSNIKIIKDLAGIKRHIFGMYND